MTVMSLTIRQRMAPIAKVTADSSANMNVQLPCNLVIMRVTLTLTMTVAMAATLAWT